MRLSTGNGFGAETDAGIGRITATEAGQFRTADFDRDGRMDVMAEVQRAAPPGQPIDRKDWVLYQSTGSKFQSYIEDVDEETADNSPDPVYFGDLDGNGMSDYLSATWDQAESDLGPWYYKLNTGKSSTARWLDKRTSTQNKVSSARSYVFDVDGDGRDEVVGWNGQYRGDARVKSFGMTTDGEIETTPAEVNVIDSASGRHFADVNGDGLRDAVYPYKGLRAQLNTGNGFGPLTIRPAGYKDPFPPTDGSQSPAVRLVDFDGDGAEDVLVFHPTHLGGGTDGAHLWTWKGNRFVRASLRQQIEGSAEYAQTLDIDGNDAQDLMYVHNGKVRILKRKAGPADLMVGAGPLVGRRMEISYTTLANRSVHAPGECEGYPLICPAAGGTIVSQHRVAIPEASDGWAKFDHTYKAARYDVRGRGWLGFAEHTVIDRRSTIMTTTTFDNTTRSGGTDGQTEVYPYARVPKQVTVTVPGHGEVVPAHLDLQPRPPAHTWRWLCDGADRSARGRAGEAKPHAHVAVRVPDPVDDMGVRRVRQPGGDLHRCAVRPPNHHQDDVRQRRDQLAPRPPEAADGDGMPAAQRRMHRTGVDVRP